MEYSRAVATGLNYLETRYGLEAIPVEHKDGIRFEGRNSHAPIVVFSRSKLDSNDFIVSFRDLNNLVINEEIKFENVNRLRRRIARTQNSLDARYGLLTKYLTTDGACGEEVVISDLKTNLPLAKIIVLDPDTCRYSDPLYFPVNIQKARLYKEKKARKRFNIQGLGSKVLAGILFFGSKKAIADDSKEHININEANDILLYRWADYVMKSVHADIEKSEYLNDEDYDYLYGAHYVPMVSAYFNYQEQLDSAVPREYSLTSEYHGDFRNMAQGFDNDLSGHSYYKKYAFGNTLYSSGIVVDEKGSIVEKPVLVPDGYKLPNGTIKDRALAGELYNEEGDLMRAQEENINVLLPLDKGSNPKLLEAAIKIDGSYYISEALLKKYILENGRTK
jgi:hypothetical protein